ncbi:hypothetical protein GIS00_18035 [Nakamurella sp. YIM 132087]|uniref:Capsular polysaccharide biosynthesis protein n=1 Tax=Nakamurella alba TaxID=2665158 RepID=A0A7K1FNW5_9ACTN|nr:hypothetical protein [Nakamurella alba]MTD15838.1 hypothetical protein [Nakamurella alba]
MDIALYGRALWTYKWLLVVGVVVAAAAAFLVGFKIQDGKVVSRSEGLYTASTYVLIGGNNGQLFLNQVPGEAVPDGSSAPRDVDLAGLAPTYAYYVSSDVIRKAVEDQVGAFGEDEALTAIARTNMPGSPDDTGGRFSLPVLSIIGQAPTAARAQDISRAANEAFQTFVAQQQDQNGTPAEQRTTLVTLNQNEAQPVETSNPLLGVVVTGIGVLAAFIALIFVLFNVRTRRLEKERDALEEARNHERIAEPVGAGPADFPASGPVPGAPGPMGFDRNGAFPVDRGDGRPPLLPGFPPRGDDRSPRD